MDAGLQTGAVRPIARVLARWLYEQRWLLMLVLAALVIRLHWNTVVHPPSEYDYSDMRGYMRRAQGMFTSTWGPREYDAFYPYGTHLLQFAIMKLFGGGHDPTLHGEAAQALTAQNHAAIAHVYAGLGAALVGFSYLLARRVAGPDLRWVAPVVGLVLVVYYPLISLGGYFLSEVPFSLCLVASSFHLVRLVDDGRRGDALASGAWAAAGFTIRPQILLSIALFGVLWLVWRKRMPALKLRGLVWAAVPVVIVIAVSAARLHYHTGRWGLISENGKFNQVFGRCHNNKIIAEPANRTQRRTAFGPPPLIQLAKREEQRPEQWPGLDPAFEREFTYQGYIGDAEILGAYIDRCVAATGMAKQVEYSVVNAMLLWRYNVMWPDSGKPQWRDQARRWGELHANILAVPALLGLLAVFFVGRVRGLAVLAVHLWAILIVAVAYIGGARFRSPYDPIILIMAVQVVALVAQALGRRARSLAR